MWELWNAAATSAVEGRPHQICSVVGKGVLIQARLAGPALSVYRAEMMALVTALQGSGPGTVVISDCQSAY
eukprot:6294817-Amphidinium_carterae.1